MSRPIQLWEDFEIPQVDTTAITQLNTLSSCHGMHPITLDASGYVKEQCVLFKDLWNNKEYTKAIKLIHDTINHPGCSRSIDLYRTIRECCDIESLQSKCHNNLKSIVDQISALHSKECSILSSYKNLEEARLSIINDNSNSNKYNKYENKFKRCIDYLWREQQVRNHELMEQNGNIRGQNNFSTNFYNYKHLETRNF